jgi:AcrR family transcriptional regulator
MSIAPAAFSESNDPRSARADRRKAESRQRLLAAARRLFIERGYHATRPQDIARAADVGHGTFYLHFADKRECFLAFAETASVELSAFVRERLQGVVGVGPQIRALLNGVMDYAERNPGVLKAAITDLSMISPDPVPGELLVDRWAADWAELIRNGAASGAFRADYDPIVIGHAIIGLLSGGIRSGAVGDVARETLIDNLTRFLVRALVPENGGEAAKDHAFTKGKP